MLAACVASLIALLAFLTLHAIVIVPIWWSAPRGLPQVIIPSLFIAPAFHRLVHTWWHGALAGFALWICLIGPTLLKPNINNDAINVIVAALTGAAIAFAIRRDRWSALAGAFAGAAIVFASAGPLSIFKSVRAARLFAGLLPICVVYGLMIVFLEGSLQRLSVSARASSSDRARRSRSSA